MKVYIINSVFKYGSTGNICMEIEQALAAHGAVCRVAYGRTGANNEKGDGYVISNKLDLLSHVLYTRLTDKHGLLSKHVTRRLIQDIRAFEPDVIHLHNIHGYYLNYELLFEFLEEYKRPVVWTLHDCWAFTGHCAHFDAAHCEKWKTHCEACELRGEYPQSWYADKSSQNFNLKKKMFTSISKLYLITPSKWLAGVVKKSFLGKYPVEVIYNGIDLKKFYPRSGKEFRDSIGAAEKIIILGVASVWTEKKGLQDFVELQGYLDESYQIVLVGINEKQQMMMPQSIHCISRTDSVEELAEIYSAADVYFNASVEETMGLTTVEALACGVPVVVYNKTAVPEVVPEGGGMILEPGNISQVKEAVDKLADADRNRTAYSEMAHSFRKESQYEKYIEVYEKIFKECKA